MFELSMLKVLPVLSGCPTALLLAADVWGSKLHKQVYQHCSDGALATLPSALGQMFEWSRGSKNAAFFALNHILDDRINSDMMSMSVSVIFKVKCEF